MIRMEIACFLVVAFMAIMYFSAKREKTKLHNVFSCFLIVSMLHLILDATTIYTVNHLENIPRWANDILHRLFIGSMLVLFFLIYRYILLLAEDESEQNLQRSPRSTVVLVLAEICAFILPIDYMQTEMGNYSYGPAANTTYGCIALYVIFTIIALCRYWKQLHTKKKIAICTALAVLIVASVYQAFHPLALISGMGVMLIGLSFYLTLENPDIQLVKQVQEEKKKAEEANAAKSVFLSNVSHEIRTPMNAVVGMADILLRTNLDKDQKEYLYNIKKSSHALISIINDILDISKIEAGEMEPVKEEEAKPFIAPKAQILIVEDNEINRKVAVGLLEPLRMQIDLAVNGKEALSMIENRKYDLVFMDHMMPVMDGVEAVQRLRLREDDYSQNLPVIAFTANAMKESEIMLKNAGMNDFLPKPIEYPALCKMVYKWLPQDLIEETTEDTAQNKPVQQPKDKLKGINIAEGIKYSGSEELWKQLMGNFYTLIDAKSRKLQQYLEDGMLREFTIEVHALKSSSRVIGAAVLSERFKQLEELGNQGDEKKIRKMLPDVLELYQSYKSTLKPYGTLQINKIKVPKEEIILYLEGIQNAIDNFDLDVADEAMQKLEKCVLPESFRSYMESLRVYIADVDMENILQTTKEMLDMLQEAELLL